ncbi:MAG: S8 family serine peptidase [Bacteroidetes bacterium]|nr:S8 family serine peptidase [Bacteroidota bacterium]
MKKRFRKKSLTSCILNIYSLKNGGGSSVLFLVLTLILLFSGVHNSVSQDLIPGVLIVNANTEEARPSKGKMVKSEALLDLFSDYGVTSYTQSMPFARTPSLHNVYKIEFTGDQQDFIDDLEQNAPNMISGIEQLYEPVGMYEPEDHLWKAGSLWHLNIIQADSAWDYTRSSDSIDITVIDQFVPDLGHPDLATKINPPFDPYSGTVFPIGMNVMFHSSTVCSFAAAETTETGGTALGQLAASGFNSNIIYIIGWGDQVQKALFASTVLETEVINISTHTGFHNPNMDTVILARKRTMFNEIFENGTVVVASAGNDPLDPPPVYFNGYVDERIIQVSGTDSTDHFGIDDGFGGVTSFSHFSAVDLCAPGYSMYGPDRVILDSVDSATGDTVYYANLWPYYGGHSGTSFSAPIVAGVAALIKSINPCLAPEDVQEILKSTTDTIVDASSYVGTIGTGRLNAYKAVKLAYESYSFQNYTIQSGENLTWNDVHFIDTLYLEPNSSLTINKNCFFNTGGHILIDTLAKLNVNNATLTTTCHNMWYGIQVWGKTEASQYPNTSYNYIQGRLVLNNATIKNAHEAVSLWKDGDLNSTGGYVIAENSTFINNRRSVAFMSYHNYHPISLNPDWNFSRFNNCDFIVDEHYLGDSPFHGMVSLWDVEGVSFSGCDFVNNSDSIYDGSGNLIDEELTGFGLWSVNAGYEVSSACNSQAYPCPEEYVDSSRFEKLEYGIHAINTKSANTITIKNSIFDDNITGLYTSAIMQPTITFNTFKINPVNTYANEIYGGLYLDNYTTGFIVEENMFTDGQGVTLLPGIIMQSVGMCVNNSGSDDNFIYNNTFENLYVGVLAQNYNRSNDPLGDNGLEIKCNQFFNIQYDIAVTTNQPLNLMSGIKGNQGSNGAGITDPAGNIFSPYNEQVYDAWDIYTEVPRAINYWYHANQNGYELRPDSVTFLIVQTRPNTIVDPFDLDDACPSNYSGGGGIEELKGLVTEMEFKTDSVSELLSLLVDGGNTDATIIDVETAWPDQTMEVRNDLLNKSPYLSDTVMVTTVQQEDVLPAAIVTEILTANPQSAKSDRVLDEVYARNDITNSQIDQIEANDMIIGAKESLEIRKAQYAGFRNYAVNRLIAAFKSDTLNTGNSDSIISLLNQQDFTGAKYQLAFEYLAIGQLQQAQDEINAIDDNYELDTQSLNEHIQLEAYLGILVQLAQSNSNIYQLTATQKTTLYNIYQNSTERAGAWAMNILRTVDTLTYKENYLLPDGSNKSSLVKRQRPNNEVFESSKLKVYPNPAKDYVIVEYQLAGDTDKAVVKVIDNNGFIRQAVIQQNNHGFAVMDTRELEPGTYICHVSANGILVGVAKFIVVN